MPKPPYHAYGSIGMVDEADIQTHIYTHEGNRNFHPHTHRTGLAWPDCFFPLWQKQPHETIYTQDWVHILGTDPGFSERAGSEQYSGASLKQGICAPES